MDNKTRIENLAEEKYLVLFGVRKATFDVMLAILVNYPHYQDKNFQNYSES